jgi:hypothetical protein
LEIVAVAAWREGAASLHFFRPRLGLAAAANIGVVSRPARRSAWRRTSDRANPDCRTAGDWATRAQADRGAWPRSPLGHGNPADGKARASSAAGRACGRPCSWALASRRVAIRCAKVLALTGRSDKNSISRSHLTHAPVAEEPAKPASRRMLLGPRGALAPRGEGLGFRPRDHDQIR